MKKVRVVFMNLHANEMLVKNLSKIMFKQSVAIKHRYFLEWLLQQPNIEVCNYITKDGFSMGGAYGKLGKALNMFRFWESRYVLRKNGLKGIKVIKRADRLNNDDIIIIPRFGLTQNPERLNGYKAFSMMHFGGGEQHISSVLRTIGVNCIYNESNLMEFSEMYRKFYSWFKGDFVVHPFVYQERFKNIKPFRERENKLFATGTVTYKENEEFLSVYNDSCVQPARKMMKDNAQKYPDLIFSTCSDYSEDVKMGKISKKANIFKRIKYTWDYKTKASQQKKYYSFNMVDMFNNYKMFAVGEEILGVPGIGFVEGMACGSAFVGLRGMYEQYGMKEGVHYIGYDGSLEDFLAKIRFYQQPEHQEELERIANAGYEFAKAHFNDETVAKDLFNKLVEAKKEWHNNIKE